MCLAVCVTCPICDMSYSCMTGLVLKRRCMRRRRRSASTTHERRGMVCSMERVSEVIVKMLLYLLTIKNYFHDSTVCCKMRYSYARIEYGMPQSHFCVFNTLTLQCTAADFTIYGPPFFLLSFVLLLTNPRLSVKASQLCTRLNGQ